MFNLVNLGALVVSYNFFEPQRLEDSVLYIKCFDFNF